LADCLCRIKVMDDSSYQKDRLLGWACYRLDRLPQGLLLVHLRGEDSKPTTGMLLLTVQSKYATGLQSGPKASPAAAAAPSSVSKLES
jgi:hypothetical protein